MQLQTERCVVRRFLPDDIDAFMVYRNNLEWMRFQGYKGKARQEYERFLLAQPNLVSGAQFAIAAQNTNALLGDLFIQQDGDVYWLGYTISPNHARRGYAFEVVNAAIQHLWSNGAAAIMAGVEPGNNASVNLLNKLGFQYLESDADGEWIYRLESESK